MPTAGQSDTSVDEERAQEPLILAVDVGTSSTRALVYDACGRAVADWKAQSFYDVETTSDGGAVLDPVALRDAVYSCLDHVSGQLVGARRSAAAVAADTFWHSVLGVSGDGRPLTPVYTWADTRAAGAAEKLRSLLSEDEIHARTGCSLHSSYVPAKLYWLQTTQPALFRAAAYWMSFGEWLYLWLFGARRVSISMASGSGLLEQEPMKWDRDLLQVLSVDPSQLSDLADFDDDPSQLPTQLAQRWPALAGAPWFLPLGDGACNNVGSAGLASDRAVAMIGTSGALRVLTPSRKTPLPRNLWTYRVDRRYFVQGGALSAGGNVAEWLESTLRLPPLPDVEAGLVEKPPDAHGLTVLPFLAGERSPDWNPHATGAIVGLDLHTTAEDIAQAAFEAIAYRFARIYGILKLSVGAPAGIIGTGAGLVRAPVWMQIMSDVLGTPITASRVPEATSRGAAALAFSALGHTDLARRPGPLGTEYAPRPERTRLYAAAIDRQDRLYRLLVEGGAEE